jgi:hypothetical protein
MKHGSLIMTLKVMDTSFLTSTEKKLTVMLIVFSIVSVLFTMNMLEKVRLLSSLCFQVLFFL